MCNFTTRNKFDVIRSTCGPWRGTWMLNLPVWGCWTSLNLATTACATCQTCSPAPCLLREDWCLWQHSYVWLQVPVAKEKRRHSLTNSLQKLNFFQMNLSWTTHQALRAQWREPQTFQSCLSFGSFEPEKAVKQCLGKNYENSPNPDPKYTKTWDTSQWEESWQRLKPWSGPFVSSSWGSLPSPPSPRTWMGSDASQKVILDS